MNQKENEEIKNRKQYYKEYYLKNKQRLLKQHLEY